MADAAGRGRDRHVGQHALHRDLNNDFLAIDVSNGKTLYRFNTGGPVGGGVISYEIGGKQYVATTSFVVSGFFGGSGPPAIIIFSLP